MSDDELLDELLVRWEDEHDQGRDLTPEELCRDCPHLAARVAQEIAKLKQFRSTPAFETTPIPPPSPPMGPPPPPVKAFEGLRYEPRRYIGEGGLGVVFMAYDKELEREVALKRIQPLHADTPSDRARFVREAEITGWLEHPGVVPLYGRGRDADGRPYYAMRFIRGKNLGDPGENLGDAIKKFYKAESGKRDAGERGLAFRGLLQRFTAACNTVAYAHSRGVIHRDLKPANIMLGPYGETLVVDWGLAKYVGRDEPHSDPAEESVRPAALPDGDGTPAGAAMGTVAYMSPEQALGQTAAVGPASDVFSLGATLYEILTSQTAYRGALALVDAAAGMFPRPRQVRRDVPPALEAVCLKAMAFRPEERYATALELARDVDRWLADEPTTAYREPWRVRARRWVKRHRTSVTATAAALLVAALLVGGGVWWKADQDAAAKHDLAQHVNDDLEAFRGLLGEGKLEDAREAVAQAKGRLRDGGPDDLQRSVRQAEVNLNMAVQAAAARQAEERDRDVRSELVEVGRLRDQGRLGEARKELEVAEKLPAELVQRVRQAGKDLDMVAELEEAPLLAAQIRADKLDLVSVGESYRKAFQVYGIDVDALTPTEAAARIRASDIREQLIVALDYRMALPAEDPERFMRRCLDVAERADDDDQRKQLRQAWAQGNRQTLEALLDHLDVPSLPPTTAVAISLRLQQLGSEARSEQVLRAVQQKNPSNFEVNYNLFAILYKTPARRQEAEGFLRAALAVRPDSPAPHLDLGVLLDEQGRPKEAETEFRRAIHFKDDYPKAHYSLGIVLDEQGKQEEAETELRRAIHFKDDFPEAHYNLGFLLAEQNRLKEAETEFRRAIQLKDDYPEAHNNLGVVLRDQNQLKDAEKEYRRAIQLKDDDVEPHNNLGIVLMLGGQDRQEEAEKEFRRAIQLKDDSPASHYNLAKLLAGQNRLKEAEKEYRRIIQLKEDDAEAHAGLGDVLLRQDRCEEAVKEFSRAIQLKDDDIDAHVRLSLALSLEGKLSEANQSLQRALQLLPSEDSRRSQVQGMLTELQHLILLDEKLPAVLKGEVQVKATEKIEFADLCQHKAQYAAAARLYAEAFAQQPALADDPIDVKRFHAACAAALAGAGKGADASGLDEMERAHLRSQALDWLRADLTAWENRRQDYPQDGPEIRQFLEGWRYYADLAGVRDADALAKLPDTEREDWRKFWTDVDALLVQVDGSKAP